jgi:hypothetical protein
MKKYGTLLVVLLAVFVFSMSACATVPAVEDPAQAENPLMQYSMDEELTIDELKTWTIVFKQQMSPDMGFFLAEREDGARAMLLVYLPKRMCVGYTYVLKGELVIMEMNISDGRYVDITDHMKQNDPDMVDALAKILTLPVHQ